MRYFLLFIILLFSRYVSAEDISTHIIITPETLETMLQSTDLLISDPLAQAENTFEDNLISDSGMSVLGLTTNVSARQKLLSIPLSYRIGKFSFRLNIPYFFSRSMIYNDEKKTSTGIGDIVSSVNFEISKKSWKSIMKTSLKVPTGDENANDGSFMVPLGTGSYDFAFHVLVLKTYRKFGIGLSAEYRQNGRSEKLTEGTISDSLTVIGKYEIYNGNSLDANFLLEHFLTEKITISSLLCYKINYEGFRNYNIKYYDDNELMKEEKFSDISNKQDFIRISISPILTYKIAEKSRIKGISFNLGMTFPILFEKNDLNLTENYDDISLYFSMTKNLLL